MDIQPSTAPAPATSHSTDKSTSSKEAHGGKVAAPAFSALLQGLHAEAAEPLLPLALQGQEQAPIEPVLDLGVLPVWEGILHIDGLVHQTQRLDVADADVDTALQNGSFLLARQAVAWSGTAALGQGWGAQPQIAAGQQVATVAAGVQTVLNAQVPADGSTPQAMAAAVLEGASDSAESVAQTLLDSLKMDDAREGRVALQGAWQLDDPQAPPNPALQRLLGQVEQWAAASAGVQPKATERGDGTKSSAATAELLAAGPGSGTRLTEHAVKEAQQAQDTGGEPHPEGPVQDMRFWLQGKQQRAAVVMEKDGQPVRVQVSVRGNEAHVTFHADQAHTRELLDASLEQLRAMLEQQGVALAGVSVQADARGDQPASRDGPRTPWEAAPTQHAQIAIPGEGGVPAPARRTQGLDLYA